MLQRALASLLCLLGVAAIGLGIASATLWRPSDTLTATARAAEGTTLLLTEPGVLDLAADDVAVRASAEGDARVVLAVGRTADVEAWVGEDAVTRVTGLLDRETLATEDVAAAEPEEPAEPTEQPAEPPADQPAEPPADQPAEEPAPVLPPDPAGSDLWLWEESGDGAAELDWSAQEGRWSLLVATTGEDAPPPAVTLTWPQVVTTPWLVPGVVVGSLLLLAGLAWWALLLLRARRTPAPAAAAVPSRAPVGATPGTTTGTAPVTGAAARPGELVGAGAAGERGTTPAPDVPGTTGPGAAAATGPVTDPAAAAAAAAAAGAPLTRRQLRELEQRRAAELAAQQTRSLRLPHLRREQPTATDSDAPGTGPTTGQQPAVGAATGTPSGGPSTTALPRVDAPAPDAADGARAWTPSAPPSAVTPPAATPPSAPTSPVTPPAATPPSATPPATTPSTSWAPAAPASPTSATPITPPAPSVPAAASAAPSTPDQPARPASADEAAGQRGWSQRFEAARNRLTGRRGDATPAAPAPAPTPQPEPPSVADAGRPVTGPSGDAWRRAWGFPSPSEGGPAGPAPVPGARPDQEGAEHRPDAAGSATDPRRPGAPPEPRPSPPVPGAPPASGRRPEEPHR